MKGGTIAPGGAPQKQNRRVAPAVQLSSGGSYCKATLPLFTKPSVQPPPMFSDLRTL